MGISFLLNNHITISGRIPYDIYESFTKRFSEILKKYGYDYSSYFELDNETFDFCSILKFSHTKSERGIVVDAVIWLKLVEIFVLRPHGLFFDNQHLNFTENQNGASTIIIVTFFELNGDLTTIFNRYFDGESTPAVAEKIILREEWLLLVSQMANEKLID